MNAYLPKYRNLQSNSLLLFEAIKSCKEMGCKKFIFGRTLKDSSVYQFKIPYTSCDHVLIKYILSLFDKLYQRRMRIRLVGIRFSGLVRGTYQINIFEDTVEMMALYQAMDKIKNRFGFDAVTRCAGTILKTKSKEPIQENPLKGDFYYKNM